MKYIVLILFSFNLFAGCGEAFKEYKKRDLNKPLESIVTFDEVEFHIQRFRVWRPLPLRYAFLLAKKAVEENKYDVEVLSHLWWFYENKGDDPKFKEKSKELRERYRKEIVLQ